MWSDITFANPYILLSLLLIPLFLVYYIKKYHKRQAPLRYSSLAGISKRKSWKARFYPVLFGFRMLAFILLIIALARPQSSTRQENISIEGIDILISLDVSTSMLATDFRPNRLEAAKSVAQEFIADRKNDRLGLVIFSAEAFAQSPLTTDHQMVSNLFEDIKTGMLKDGTAIGEGLATAVSRLKNGKAKSKVIILLTDGVNNSGSIDPLTAAEMAKTFDIRVYTIGVGSKGKARVPVGISQATGQYVFRQREVNIDEELLKNIAQSTNGQYFRATNKEKLAEIYQSINKLEKSKIDVQRYEHQHEEFFLFALIGGILLILEWILRKTIFRTIP